MRIGPHKLLTNLILAPMAGVTDRPFRQLCRKMGAGLAVSEMVTSNPALRNSRKTQHRLDHRGEDTPRSVQIVGTDPSMMADAAKYNVTNGAEIIDINMGCPAKKVCNVMAGSALLRDEKLVAKILEHVIRSVHVPVTLKIRTGWDKDNRNAVNIAKIAEQAGVQALTIHGRTRACGFSGNAEHETATEIKSRIQIPVIVNGDIDSPVQAVDVLQQTGADAVMIGRAAQGNPFIFREIAHYLATGKLLAPPSLEETCVTLVNHVKDLHKFYGEIAGVRIARKHISWYCKKHTSAKLFLAMINQANSAAEQIRIIRNYFTEQMQQKLAA